ncbi:MAG: 23S rRNA (guanosine(2251)-2'-O)-methyltransferase RlmB [Rhodocyclaceae bacterium]|nr:23S rRNA (guanosine(2251)-2'-O)-methyltransferase RlmB [Rhodocyclaceae bacterium]
MPEAIRLIHGFHALHARLRAAPESVLEILLSANRKDARSRQLMALAAARGIRLSLVEPSRLDALAPNARHQGVIARVKDVSTQPTLEEILAHLDEPALLLVLDSVTDPRNLGACLRAADGLGAQAVIAPKDRACGLTATAIKVASGAAESTPYLMVTNLARALRTLKEHGIWVVGAEGSARKTVFEIDQRGPIAWVLGAEGAGLRRLSRATCDELARIPMSGAVESLNVAVAAGICLYEARRQRLTTASTTVPPSPSRA